MVALEWEEAMSDGDRIAADLRGFGPLGLAWRASNVKRKCLPHSIIPTSRRSNAGPLGRASGAFAGEKAVAASQFTGRRLTCGGEVTIVST
jgi:hypothetical protein